MTPSDSRVPLRADPNDGYESLTVTLGVAQLDQLKALAVRSHDGSISVQHVRDDAGLPWIEVSVLLTDMGERARPFHTFYMSPKGVLRPGDQDAA